MAQIDVTCLGCESAACNFKPLQLQRRALGASDVLVEMKYCGVCHSDGACTPFYSSHPLTCRSVHIARGHLSMNPVTCARGSACPLLPSHSSFPDPIVPGHELAGVCTAVGSAVTRFAVGDHVGVGCFVDSCLTCAACLRGEEQKCSAQVSTVCDSPHLCCTLPTPSAVQRTRQVRPRNGRDKSGRAVSSPAGSQTLGGYSTKMVIHERFAIKLVCVRALSSVRVSLRLTHAFPQADRLPVGVRRAGDVRGRDAF